MSHAHLLLYREDFTEKRNRPAPPPATPPAPGFDADDLHAARTDGYAAGEAAGRAAEVAGQHARIAAVLERLAGRLDAAEDAAVAAVETRAQALARVMLDALAAAFPSLAAQHGAAEMRRVIASLLPALSRQATVTLHVPPDLLEAAQAELDALRLCRATPPLIAADAALQPGDIEIVWDDGRAARDSAAIWRDALAALAPLDLPDETFPFPRPTE